MNYVTAINAAIALTRLIGHMSDNLRKVGELIERAQAENRDLSPEEIAQVQAERRSAVDAYLAAANPEETP